MNSNEAFLIGGCARRRQGIAANGAFERPGSKPGYGPDQEFDVQHLRLELEPDIPKKTLAGECAATLRAIHDGARTIDFDAARMQILSVRLDSGGKPRFTYQKDKLKIRLPRPCREGERLTVFIRYKTVNPAAGVYFVGPDRAYPDKPVQLWTHGEAEESRYWFPCFDAPHDKATTEMVVTVPEDFFALSNGALLDVRPGKRRKSRCFHWRQSVPHSPYLVTLVAGKFSEIKEEWEGIPVLYYCQPGREADTKRAFGKTPKMMQFFSDVLGVRYPYEKYAQIAVTDFVMGGMEHTTATTQTDRVLMDARAYPEFKADWLVSHELAHQWFGDLLTCKEWSHAWLNESFATYFEALFTEHDLGRDEFLYEMFEKAESYLEESRKNYQRAIVTNVYRAPDDLFDRHLYEKGACVLHMLRRHLGDDLFWKMIRRYAANFRGQAVETADLINAAQEATGRNLRRFFDQWIYGAGHPEYTVHYWWEEKKKTACLRVTQKAGRDGRCFSVPVTLEFITRRGNRKMTETIEKKEQEFRYRFESEPLDFRFDPEHSILKSAAVSKPYSMWARQLASDPHPVGRLLASREIAKVKRGSSLQHLCRAFLKERFWGAAGEIALSIGRLKSAEAGRFLRKSLALSNPKVRRAVAEALANFNDPETAAALIRLFRREKSYFVRAQALRSLSRSLGEKALPLLKRALKVPSWNDTIRAAAAQGLSHSPTEESLRLVRKQALYGQPLSCRMAALQAMRAPALAFPEIYGEILRLAEDPQMRLRQAAVSALGELKDPRALPLLSRLAKDKNLPQRIRHLAEDARLKIKPETPEK